jgi:hypothetical protein
MSETLGCGVPGIGKKAGSFEAVLAHDSPLKPAHATKINTITNACQTQLG